MCLHAFFLLLSVRTFFFTSIKHVTFEYISVEHISCCKFMLAEFGGSVCAYRVRLNAAVQ